ncbi:MAG: hypothetical protein K6G81_09900 [Lachnospiraceae bacterium]|nr:hypothetical protein [Lachnospiraceae bacterium]
MRGLGAIRGDMTTASDVNMMKFPIFLRKTFVERMISFPDGTQWNFEKVYAYRVVEWKGNRSDHVTINDFLSKAEVAGCKGLPRGISNDVWDNPLFYGVSLFKDVISLKNCFKFPRLTKRLAQGYVVDSGGPIYFKDNESHITWWLFDGVEDVLSKNFVITEDEETNNE